MAEEKKELFNKINNELKTALKEKNELRLSALRMIKSKILYVNARGDLPEAEIIKIITKYAKEIKESITEFRKVDRADDAAKAEAELVIVQEFLPKQLSADEVKAAVQKAVEDSGATSIKDMGKVMKEVLGKHPGIDGKVVSQFVRELLK